MHGKQVTEVGKRATYWKTAKVEYCTSLEEGIGFSLIKLGTNVKLWEYRYAINTLNSVAVIQKDLDMLEEWADRNPHFCQHRKTAKLCAVCDTGAVSCLSARSSSGRGLGIFKPGGETISKQPTQPPAPGDHKMVEPQFSVMCAVKTKNNWFKLKQGSFKECVRKNIFTLSQSSCEACCPKSVCSLHL